MAVLYSQRKKHLIVCIIQVYMAMQGGSLVNHASQPAEESLANMRTLSRAGLYEKSWTIN